MERAGKQTSARWEDKRPRRGDSESHSGRRPGREIFAAAAVDRSTKPMFRAGTFLAKEVLLKFYATATGRSGALGTVF